MGRGQRALRGGSWNNNEDNARVSGRNNNNPNNRNNNIGFRVVVLALHKGVFHVFLPAVCLSLPKDTPALAGGARVGMVCGSASRHNWLTLRPVGP